MTTNIVDFEHLTKVVDEKDKQLSSDKLATMLMNEYLCGKISKPIYDAIKLYAERLSNVGFSARLAERIEAYYNAEFQGNVDLFISRFKELHSEGEIEDDIFDIFDFILLEHTSEN